MEWAPTGVTPLGGAVAAAGSVDGVCADGFDLPGRTAAGGPRRRRWKVLRRRVSLVAFRRSRPADRFTPAGAARSAQCVRPGPIPGAGAHFVPARALCVPSAEPRPVCPAPFAVARIGTLRVARVQTESAPTMSGEPEPVANLAADAPKAPSKAKADFTTAILEKKARGVGLWVADAPVAGCPGAWRGAPDAWCLGSRCRPSWPCATESAQPPGGGRGDERGQQRGGPAPQEDGGAAAVPRRHGAHQGQEAEGHGVHRAGGRHLRRGQDPHEQGCAQEPAHPPGRRGQPAPGAWGRGARQGRWQSAWQGAVRPGCPRLAPAPPTRRCAWADPRCLLHARSARTSSTARRSTSCRSATAWRV